MHSEFPYNLPIWRRSHKAESPDQKYVAEIDSAWEISMGNPTYGTLKISNGMSLPKCNPSFIWSEDSRYLAVPQYFTWCFLFRRQRMILMDFEKKKMFASKKHTWYFQPESFIKGLLVATLNPFRNPENPAKMEWRIPEELEMFWEVDVSWP